MYYYFRFHTYQELRCIGNTTLKHFFVGNKNAAASTAEIAQNDKNISQYTTLKTIMRKLLWKYYAPEL